jgi:tetratricopeptide (TPR) repeat protein
MRVRIFFALMILIISSAALLVDPGNNSSHNHELLDNTTISVTPESQGIGSNNSQELIYNGESSKDLSKIAPNQTIFKLNQSQMRDIIEWILGENPSLIDYLSLAAIIYALYIFFCGIIKYGSRYFKHFKPKAPPEDEIQNQKQTSKYEEFLSLKVWDTRPPTENFNFVGRKSVLDDINNFLNSGSNIYVISGTAGIGKTQIAAKYLYQHNREYKYTWWLRSEDTAALRGYFASLAAFLVTEPDFPKVVTNDQETTINVIKVWLEKEHTWKWLLVFDNARGPEDIIEFLPRSGSGHIIITTRDSSSSWDKLTKPHLLGKFEPNEAIEFLIKRTELDDSEGAKAIAIHLDYLPLALEAAGAYLKSTGRSFSHYVQQLQSNKMKMLSQHKTLEYPMPVSRIWDISFTEAERDAPLSASILYLCSFLGSEGIPISLLDQSEEYLVHSESNSTSNFQEDLDNTLQILNSYSLITVIPDAISIHRLVQDVIRSRLKEEGQKKWAEIAIKIVIDLFPKYNADDSNSLTCLRLLPHALIVSQYAEKLAIAHRENEKLLRLVVVYLNGRADFNAAKASMLRLLEIDEHIYGPNSKEIAEDSHYFGVILSNLGDLNSAKEHLENALSIDKKLYDPYDPIIARDLSHLGSINCLIGDFEKAKQNLEEALDIDKVTKEHSQSNMGRDLCNYGIILLELNDLDAARKNFENALDIYQWRYGNEHQKVASVLNNLGVVLRNMGFLEDARKCTERSLGISQKKFAPNHPITAINLCNLGLVFNGLGDFELAKENFQKALEMDKKIYGFNHRDVYRDLICLGDLLHKMGKLKESEDYYKQASEIKERNKDKTIFNYMAQYSRLCIFLASRDYD